MMYIMIDAISGKEGAKSMRNLEKDELEMTSRREAMLSEGFRLFSEKGIEAVSMQEVAAACGVGIATLYRYFNTKFALVLAISVRQWAGYEKYVREMREKHHANGMPASEELSFYLDFYIDLYKNHKDILRFNQDFNNFVRHERATPEQLKPYVESIDIFARMVNEVYNKGKEDGTIRTDLPKEKMFASTSHIMLAVVVRYAQGLLFSGSEVDMSEEVLMTKRMILREFVVS